MIQGLCPHRAITGMARLPRRSSAIISLFVLSLAFQPQQLSAAPPANAPQLGSAPQAASKVSWSSNTAVSAAQTAAPNPYTLGSLPLTKQNAKGKTIAPGQGKKGLKLPAKIAAQEGLNPNSEWVVEGLPQTIDEITEARKKIARKEKSYVRVEKKKPSWIQRHAQK